jgi:hypothetical protein
MPPDIPIPNAIVVTLPDIHRAAAAKLRLSGDPTMVELARGHEEVARGLAVFLLRQPRSVPARPGIARKAFDGKDRLKSKQRPCRLFSLRHLCADSDSHPQS